MNLILIAALVAVAGADKLDRAYLPPASAKTAGGSADNLKTPFAGNSFNNGLGGLPKGSYTNDFQGVVVDAVAPGTRASEGESGLGAPRISYGSTASKVGAAAFNANQAGFRQPADGFQTGFDGSAVDGQAAGTEITQGFQTQGNNRNQFSRPQGQNERARAALDRAASIVRFESDVGAENFNYAFETDNGITAEESGVAVNGVQAQGGFSYTGDDGQVYSVTYTADEGGYQPKGDHLPTPPPIPEEILRSLEQNARDEAAGLIDDGSYDAQKYNAEGDYSESDGANGRYSHQSSQFGNRGEADATASGTFISQNNQPFARPGQSGPNSLSGSNSGSNSIQGSFGSNSGQFGQAAAGPTGSGSFTGQASGHFGSNSLNSQGASNSQVSGESQGQFGTGNTELSGQSQQGDFQGHFGSNTAFGNKQGSNSLKGSSNSQGNKFTTSTTAQVNSGFNQGSNGFTGSGSSLGNRFSASATTQGNNGLGESSNSAINNQRLGQNQGNRFSASASAQENNGLGESSNSANNNQRLEQNQGNVFGNRNEYLPPVNHFGSNVKQPSRPQASFPSNQQSDQQSNTNNQNINVQPLAQQNLQGQVRPQSSNNGNSQFAGPTSGSEQMPNNFNAAGSTQTTIANKNEYLPPFGQNRPTQNRPQSSNDAPTGPQFSNFNNAETSANFQSPVQNRPQNSFSSSASISESSQSTFEPSTHQSNSFQRPQANARPNQPTKNQIPSFGTDKQSQFESTKLAPQQGTSQPDTELTTPFENSGPQYNVAAGGSKPTPSTPTSRPQSFNAGSNIGPTSPSSRPSFGSQPSAGPQKPSSRPFAQSPAFPTQPSEIQYEEEHQFSNRKPQPSKINGDAQFSPSTQRPSFAPQGADDSYYYKQPSKPFNTPQDSRFPSASSNKFDSMSSNSPSYSSQSNRFPVASQQNAQSQSGNFQGPSRYPQRPTVPSLSPTTSSQPSNGFTGITQAAISPFPSETPTQATQFIQQGQFGSRPGSQTNNFGQSKPSKPSFGQTSAQASTGIQATQGPANSRKPTFQGQQFSQQTQNQDQTQSQDESESRPSQQYNGEIYEYKKPAQTLPAPDSTDSDTAGSSSGHFSQTQQSQSQFGRRPSQSKFGQAQSDSDSQSSSTSQFSQGSRPQFGSPSRPQFGQSQSQGALSTQTQNRQQFGAQPSRPFGGSSSQTQNIQSPQPTQFSASASAESSFSQSSQPIPTQSSQFGRPQGFQSQFGSKNPSFAGSQGFKQNPTTSNFAGKGEEFGGPRPPPSFNPQTGYTY